MNKTRGLLLTAGFVLATAFTFSCSGDDGGGGGGDPSSSSGGGEPSGGGNACTNLEPVTIGSQKWAKKNLDCEVGESKCYENNSANCTTYGRLYNWETAMIACPSGWRLPNTDEWLVLMDYVGGYETAGAKLKATSGWNWNDDDGISGNGTDNYSFTALPGGFGSNSSFEDVGIAGGWWSTSEKNSEAAYALIIDYDSEYAKLDEPNKLIFVSVRCIKD